MTDNQIKPISVRFSLPARTLPDIPAAALTSHFERSAKVFETSLATQPYLIAAAITAACRWRSASRRQVAERHCDQVGWVIVDNAWRFSPVSDEVL